MKGGRYTNSGCGDVDGDLMQWLAVGDDTIGGGGVVKIRLDAIRSINQSSKIDPNKETVPTGRDEWLIRYTLFETPHQPVPSTTLIPLILPHTRCPAGYIYPT